MTALYIILGILSFIFLILVSSVSVNVKVIDDISVSVGFWFLKFKILPSKKRRSKSKQKKDADKPNYLKQMIEEKGIFGTVSELISIAKVILKKVGKTAKHIRVRKFWLLIIAASDDPAETGMLYGRLCGIVFPALRAFQSALKWNDRKTKVSVTSDFLREKPDFALELKCKLRVWHILVLGLGVLTELVKRRLNTATANINKISVDKTQKIEGMYKYGRK